MGQALGVTAIGSAIGIAGALLLTRLMQSLLYGVSATDPLPFVAAGLAPPAVAILASAVPALRAARLNAVEALRHE